jgi:hypothetical protein
MLRKLALKWRIFWIRVRIKQLSAMLDCTIRDLDTAQTELTRLKSLAVFLHSDLLRARYRERQAREGGL